MNKKNHSKKNTESGSRLAVRVLCLILAGLMVLGGITTLLMYLFG